MTNTSKDDLGLQEESQEDALLDAGYSYITLELTHEEFDYSANQMPGLQRLMSIK